MKTNMKILVVTFIAMTFTSIVNAQTKSSHISGKITDAAKAPVPFATATLLKAQDSSLVKGAIADLNGVYSFENIIPGKYIIAAINMGMAKNYSAVLVVDGNKHIAVPDILLHADTKKLSTVEIIKKKPFIEQRADKTIVNVENSIVGAGSTAMEVLQKAPGVVVDKDDNISLKGKSGVNVMIDGKMVNMTSQDLAQYLKSMPSSNVEQIELISNPSSKYDASGTAGIINIKLKKNKNYGTNGNFTLSGGKGVKERYNAALFLNHRNKNFNIFGNLSRYYQTQYEHLRLSRDNEEKDRTIHMKQINDLDKKYDNYSGKIGMDYFINKNHTLGFMADGTLSNWIGNGDGSTKIGDLNSFDSTLLTTTDNKANWDRYTVNVNYKGKLDTLGKELNVDLDIARNKNDMKSHIYSLYEKGQMVSDPTFVRNYQPATIDIRTAKLDYTHPLKNGAKFEAGVKLSWVTSDNDVRFDSLRKESWVYDTIRSNHFVYKENVNAAYLNFSKNWKKWSLQAGLRMEQTNISGVSTAHKQHQENDSSYINLFPSIFISYNPSEKNTFGFSYSRRLQRPSYENLNPFELFLDNYTTTAGNPGLKPQYMDNFEISHTFHSFLTTSISYGHTKDGITRIIEPGIDPVSGDTLILRYKYQNVAVRHNYSFNVSAPYEIKKWWNVYTTMSLYYNSFKTNVSGDPLEISSAAFYAQMQHTFSLPKDYSIQLSGEYISPQVTDEGLMRMHAMGGVELGFKKQLWDKKATITLNVQDIFRTYRFTGDFKNGNRHVILSNTWDSRMVRASFTYRFGNKNVKEARQRSTGAQAELNRAQ